MSARHLSTAERQRLVALLGMLGSDHPGERDNAARLAEKFRRQYGMTWADLLNLEALPPEPPKPEPPPQPQASPPPPPPKPEPPPRPKPQPEAAKPKPSPPKPERPRQPPDGATYSERVKFWEEEEPSFTHTAFGILYGGFLMTIFTLALADHIHLIDLNALIHPPSSQIVHTAPAATPPRLAVPSTAPPTPWGISPVVR